MTKAIGKQIKPYNDIRDIQFQRVYYLAARHTSTPRHIAFIILATMFHSSLKSPPLIYSSNDRTAAIICSSGMGLFVSSW